MKKDQGAKLIKLQDHQAKKLEQYLLLKFRTKIKTGKFKKTYYRVKIRVQS